MKAISFIGFIIYYIALVIIDWGYFKNIYSLIIIFTLIPVTIQSIKEFKVNIKLFKKILLSLAYVLVGVIIIYLLGYFG